MKPGARILAVDDAPLKSSKVLCTGIVTRLSSSRDIEGILSFTVTRDGIDSAKKLVAALKKSRFNKQVRTIIVQSITLGGLNILDTQMVARELGVPVICVTKEKPEENEIQKALLKTKNGELKARLVKEAGPVYREGNVFFHAIGASQGEAAAVLSKLGGYPWPLRLAHLIGSAVVFGESRGS